MPAILTHDFFGRDAYPEVASAFGFTTLDDLDAFLLGNQGPDPLFYLIADPLAPARDRVGELMHDARPARLLHALHDALDMLSPRERRLGEAYAAGFVCHYLLDRAVHPLVYANEYALCSAGVEGLDMSVGSEVHAEIERDLDEMVLFTKTGKTVERYRPYREVLGATPQTLAVVDKLFFYMALRAYGRTIDVDVATRAVHSFRCVQWLFYSPRLVKASVLGTVERTVGHRRFSLLCAMTHRVRAEKSSPFANHDHLAWTNPFTDEPSTESFWDLYEDALGNAFDYVRAVLSDDFDEVAAEALTANLNFSGRTVNPEAMPEEAAPDPMPDAGEQA